MAYNPIYISPADLNPNLALGINIPFSNVGVFVSNYTTAKALKNNILNFLLTGPNEIPLSAVEWGGVKEYIFTQMSSGNLDFIEEDIRQKLKLYFPQITIDNFDVLSDPNFNTIIIKFTYSIDSTNIEDQVQIEITA